ncbi:toxin [Streptomyces sulfonofaciens]|uniref:Toxin n=1 Tax=Streptomyces sulfonofaciens TaxID=68272 RepID=A0A919FR31_9ACTN|nr:DUF397 domain-containing protein [Streptomyces sulfonofaciens]GHH70703.1 toxin [Streptomyces sulfonofaciens]
MGTSRELSVVTWRRSSYSGDNGGDCVECAPLGPIEWRKSSYSADNGGQCLEVATLNASVAIRDSKNPDGGTVRISPVAFERFVRAAATAAV